MHDLGVNLKKARALPHSAVVSPEAGRRVVNHPLHDTYLPPDVRERFRATYAGASLGEVVPDLRPAEREWEPPAGVIKRVSKLYTTPFRPFEADRPDPGQLGFDFKLRR